MPVATGLADALVHIDGCVSQASDWPAGGDTAGDAGARWAGLPSEQPLATGSRVDVDRTGAGGAVSIQLLHCGAEVPGAVFRRKPNALARINPAVDTIGKHASAAWPQQRHS